MTAEQPGARPAHLRRPNEPPVVLYKMYGTPGEQVIKYLPDDADLDTVLRRGYSLAAQMIERGTASPSGVRVGGVTYTMDDLNQRFGPYWEQHP